MHRICTIQQLHVLGKPPIMLFMVTPSLDSVLVRRVKTTTTHPEPETPGHNVYDALQSIFEAVLTRENNNSAPILFAIPLAMSHRLSMTHQTIHMLYSFPSEAA